MPRPNRLREQRQRLLPVVAEAFAELGYRRATTAELARRCGVQENILYRLWSDKKAMFIASIDYAYQRAVASWRSVLERGDDPHAAVLGLLEHEASHSGESGLHRLVFAGLNETDDPDIRASLRRMYGRFHRFIHEQIARYREGAKTKGLPEAALSAWAIVALGNLAHIGRDLHLLGIRAQRRLIRTVGRFLLDGGAS
ncbi:MAG: TetR/AcrR family transcriptional regulator [Planctomycetota bacterium]|nr:MAG: TetR/AcrR family transcriptional regulator [Planctomycetota bacterium]